MNDEYYTVWVVDTFENRTRIRAFESIVAATKRANRIFQSMEAEMEFGCAVHITDERGETISAQMVS